MSIETEFSESNTSSALKPLPGRDSSKADGRRLPLVGHLEELRRRIWICVLAFVVASAASFAWADRFIEWLKQPAGSVLPRLAFFSPTEAILAYMKVAMAAGLVISMPIVLYELWTFIKFGLTHREQNYGLVFVWCGSALFLAGAAFAYWVLLPISLNFLLGFGGEQLEPVISINRYLSFTTLVILACGVVFQLPLIMFILARLGVVYPQMLRQKRRYAVLFMLITAAILTPTTDVATMLLMTVPMLALYEMSIWIAALAARRRTG